MLRYLYISFAVSSAYLPDVEVKADLIGSSSGLSLSIAQRSDETCSWNKCFHSGRRIYVSGCCGNAVPVSNRNVLKGKSE